MALNGKTVVIFVDFNFEDVELLYPKIRLQEAGGNVIVCGAHPAGTKYTGKFGYPVKSDVAVGDLDISSVSALVIPGGFAPDYMRRNEEMLAIVSELIDRDVPVAAICHGPWMFCSARTPDGKPVISGRKATGFIAIKDDLINAGASWEDLPVVRDGPLITSRTPADIIPFCQEIIQAASAL